MRRCLFLACVLALLPTTGLADEVFLKGGGRISGQILSRTETSVAVNVGAGVITVPMSSVLRIEETRSVLDDYDERVASVRADRAADWLELARWAASEGLGTQARRAYERVVALDPQNVEANVALGHVLLDDRWMTEQESYRARGYVPFEGEWMAPAQRDALVQQREAARQAELARLDAEWRAREAEARAAEAEARAREAQAAAAWNSVVIPYWWGAWGQAPAGRHYPSRTSPYSTGGWPFQPTTPWLSQPLGLWPSQSLGLWPSQTLGLWPSPPPGHGGGPKAKGPPPRSPSGPPARPAPKSRSR
jgi:hypothetical protein